jgi:mRNA-degrading endonuclease RelE of RelBE toxin-antitoxin system
MFKIEFTPEAIEDLKQLREYDQRIVVESIEGQLAHQAAQETRNRKRLRPNELAEWELRVRQFRVFYDIDPGYTFAKVVAVGYKDGEKLFVHGQEYDL